MEKTQIEKERDMLFTIVTRDIDYFKEENARLLEIIRVICKNNKIDSDILKAKREQIDE